MKHRVVTIRIDENLSKKVDDATQVSGISLAEIFRRGAEYEAIQIIQLFNKRIDKRKLKPEAA